jgi:hypothetical protein
MATAIITKEELSSAIMSLQTKQEVADLLAITIDELDQEIQNNFNMTFEQKQKQMKVKIKYSKNNELIMSKKTDKNTTKLLADKVMVPTTQNDTDDMKVISLEHIKVVNNFAEGMTKIAAYKKVYEAPDSKMSDDTATKGAARVLNRPEVKVYIQQKTKEIEVIAKISKATMVSELIKLIPTSGVPAITEINKMMGYNAPTKMDMEVNGSIEHTGEVKVEFINAKE